MSTTSDSWLVSDDHTSGSGHSDDKQSSDEEDWKPDGEEGDVVDLVSDSEDDSDSVSPDLACAICHDTNNEAEMLLCDDCGRGFHMGCLGMARMPAEDVWLCPPCKQGNLEVHMSALRGASQQLTGRRTGTAAAAAAAAAAAKAALQARPVAVQPSAPAQPAPAAAPARRGRGRPRKNPQQAADDAAKRTEVLTVSITVAMKTMDVPLHIFDQLGAWLKLQCSGGIALERGGIFGHAHVQGVAKVVASTPQLVNKMIKDHLGWSQTPPLGAVVCVKKVTGKGLHTYHGLLGYIMKDEGQAHFKLLLHNVSESDIEIAKDQYLKHGAGSLKSRTVLTPNSIFSKAAVYFQLHSFEDKNNCSFQHVLLEMLRTGKYYPGAMWVIPYQGRGMSHERCLALWRMYTAPSTVQPEHVHKVFFHNGEQPEYHPQPASMSYCTSAAAHLRYQLEKYFGEVVEPGQAAEVQGGASGWAAAAHAGVHEAGIDDSDALLVDAGDGLGMRPAQESMGPPRHYTEAADYWHTVHAKVASLQQMPESSSRAAEELGAALACLNQLLGDDDDDADDGDAGDDGDMDVRAAELAAELDLADGGSVAAAGGDHEHNGVDDVVDEPLVIDRLGVLH